MATTAIGNVGLNNGSIINSNIQVYADYSQSREYEDLVVTPDQPGALDEQLHRAGTPQLLQPVRVGRLWIGPPWETPDVDAISVVIDPGRAFGTGGHATTRLCLQLLEAEQRGSVLDVGCGSGVLSIAAWKLALAEVYEVAVDNSQDPEVLALAIRATAPAGVLTSTTMYSDASTPVPLQGAPVRTRVRWACRLT